MTTKKNLIVFAINISLMVLVFVCAIYLGVFINSKRAMEDELKSRGAAIVNSLILARNWNASHGGVYVEKLPGQTSNPYLKNPDIEGAQGKVYTKKNPALMIREISENSGSKNGFSFHITSLQPVNPGNAPDAFEREALRKFEIGGKESFSRERIGGSEFYRYMAPLPVERACLGCHEGYKEGDVRGGISVRFNIDHAQAALTKNLYATVLLAILTLGLLLFTIHRLVRTLYSRLNEAESRLRTMVITDELTGLKNRRYLFERLPKEIKQSRRNQRPLSCVMFDMDNFKRLNDTFGHHMGDKVLKSVAATVGETCRESDIVCRQGGEEFVALLPGTGIDDAARTAEKLRQAIVCQPIVFEGEELTVTASFGVACFDPLAAGDGEGATARLLKRADEALYRAKGNGRNRVERSG